jgi:zinc transporter 5/7
MGSVGVIVSTLLIKFYGWTGFDPIASLFIAVLIVASVVPLVIDTGKILCLDVSSQSAAIDSALAQVSHSHASEGYSC